MELLFVYSKDGVTLSPAVFLHASPTGGYNNVWWVILLEGGILTVFTIISTYIRGGSMRFTKLVLYDIQHGLLKKWKWCIGILLMNLAFCLIF